MVTVGVKSGAETSRIVNPARDPVLSVELSQESDNNPSGKVWEQAGYS
jgi:hypothetical protein